MTTFLESHIRDWELDLTRAKEARARQRESWQRAEVLRSSRSWGTRWPPTRNVSISLGHLGLIPWARSLSYGLIQGGHRWLDCWGIEECVDIGRYLPRTREMRMPPIPLLIKGFPSPRWFILQASLILFPSRWLKKMKGMPLSLCNFYFYFVILYFCFSLFPRQCNDNGIRAKNEWKEDVMLIKLSFTFPLVSTYLVHNSVAK